MRYLFILFFFFMSLVAKAQDPLPVGSYASDFTLTDINNNTHNLYTYLDSGYTVILDISATWCGPCWTMHNSKVFKRLMEHYGPNGTIDPKKLMFIFIEGDTTATMNQLNGIGFGTQGDWLTGTNYPTVNLLSSSFKSLYPYKSYPTFYTICPNRNIISNRRTGVVATDTTEAHWLGFVNDCPVKNNGVNAALVGALDTKIATCPDVTQSIDVPIQNMGTTPLNNALVEVKINGTTQTSQAWSGNLDSYDTAVVRVPNYIGVANASEVEISVTTAGDQNPLDDTITYDDTNFKASTDQVTMELRLDQEPYNKSWKVTNSNHQVVYSSPVYTAADELTTKYYTFTIPNGECYKLELISTRGLGLLFHKQSADSAFVKIYDGTQHGTLMTNYREKYWYRFLQGFSFVAPQNIAGVVQQAKFTIAPNPANNYFQYKIDLAKELDAKLELFDMHGRVVYDADLKNSSLYSGSINIENLPTGVYNLRLAAGGATKSLRVLKQ